MSAKLQALKGRGQLTVGRDLPMKDEAVLCQHRSKLQKKSLLTFLFQEDDAKQSHSGREYVYECFSSETINIMQGNASTKEDEEK